MGGGGGVAPLEIGQSDYINALISVICAPPEIKETSTASPAQKSLGAALNH